MSFLDDTFGDLKYENIGKWVDFATNDDGTTPRIKLRRAHGRNHTYSAGLSAIINKYSGHKKDRKTTKEIDDKIAAEAYANYLIITWENFICPDSLLEEFGLKSGEHIPFSRENAIKLFKARPRFLDHVHSKVQDSGFFGKTELDEEREDEDSVKNS